MVCMSMCMCVFYMYILVNFISKFSNSTFFPNSIFVISYANLITFLYLKTMMVRNLKNSYRNSVIKILYYFYF